MSEREGLFTIEREAFNGLFDILQADGYTVVGPTVRSSTVVYERLASASELPSGKLDFQDAGAYRLLNENTPALFDYVVGPTSLKRFLSPPRECIYRGSLGPGGPSDETPPLSDERFAFVGVRPCELAALSIQDRTRRSGPFVDARYGARRDSCFLVAVNCTRPGGTCFCASMGTGPRALAGFDLALTELLENDRHYFVAESNTPAGREVLRRWCSRPATSEEGAAASARLARAELHMGRQLDTDGLAARLQAAIEHPRWEQVAARCLNCANCTLVCPTCFCSAIEDSTDLEGVHTERWRTWDSCFTLGFSYIHGGSVRTSAKSRYRQWLLHKLSFWHDQFGTAGCVGCGRCITWCPAGIDLTQEARELTRPPAPSDTALKES